ncbi:MAG: hypothetical protein ACU0BF_00770 [Paracoccaceae bacterium]
MDEGPPVAVADILFGLSAVLLIVLALLSTRLAEGIARAAETRERAQAVDALAVTRAAVAALPGAVVLATADGIEVGGARIPLSGVPDWAPGEAGPLRLVVMPDGIEADFLLTPALARAGVASVERSRLTGACGRLVARDGGGLACAD